MDTADEDAVAPIEADIPEGRVQHRDAFQAHIGGVVQDEHVSLHPGAVVTFQCNARGARDFAFGFDLGVLAAHVHILILRQAVERPTTRHGNVVRPGRVDHRAGAAGEVSRVLAQKQRGAPFKIEVDVILQMNRADGVCSGRNVDDASAGGGASIDGALDRLGRVVRAHAAGPKVPCVKGITWSYRLGTERRAP